MKIQENSIKILFFMDSLHRGGKERRMLELMKELKWRQELEFELVLMDTKIDYPEILKLNIQIHYLIRKTKKDPAVFCKFYKICKTFKPNIIHCWDSMTAVYAIPVCKFLSIKLMNGMVVDTPVKKNILNKNWLRAQLTFPFSDIIIGNSKAGLAAYKAPAKKNEYIYNGMDFARFTNLKVPSEMRKEIFGDTLEDIFVAGMVAAFEDRKDYKTLVKAAILLIRGNENVRFVLVGDGSNFLEIKKGVPELLSDKIVFLGRRSDVESIVNIFDVGILLTNSKVHGEGISNSIIEYMALAKPVIATRGGGTDEVVIDTQNGYLIDPGNEEQLLEKLKLLINQKNLKTELGKRGNQLAHEKFNLKIMANNYLRLYYELSKKNIQ